VLKEIAATRETDHGKALKDFDAAICGHVAFVISNFARALWMGFTRAFFVAAPGDAHTRRYYQQLTRLSSAFALMADAAMFVLGGSLKRRERLSARLGDVLSWLYLASAVLKRYEDSGRPADDLPLVRWALQDALAKIEQAFHGLFENLPNWPVAFVLRNVIFSYGREFAPPRDQLGQAVVNTLLEPGAARQRLTAGVFVPKNEDEPVGALEAALRAVIAAEEVEAKIRAGVKAGTIKGRRADELAAQATAHNLISSGEAAVLAQAQALRRKVIMVDDFPRDLGKSEIFQTTQAVTFESLRRRRA
jgi:acyl-CoA dehydrogenase